MGRLLSGVQTLFFRLLIFVWLHGTKTTLLSVDGVCVWIETYNSLLHLWYTFMIAESDLKFS